MMMFTSLAFADDQITIDKDGYPIFHYEVVLQSDVVNAGDIIVSVEDTNSHVILLLLPNEQALANQMIASHVNCNILAQYSWGVMVDKNNGVNLTDYHKMLDNLFEHNQWNQAIPKTEVRRVTNDVFRSKETDLFTVAKEQYVFCMDTAGMILIQEGNLEQYR